MKTMARFSLLLLSVLLAACSKEGNEEGPVGPYELSVYPPEVGFHAADFCYPDADESIFSDTLFIKGGIPPYRIEPVEKMFDIGLSECDEGQFLYMKTMDVFDYTVRSVPHEVDQLIIKCVYYENKPACGSEHLLFWPVEFIVYDKNGGYAKFEVRDFDLIEGW